MGSTELAANLFRATQAEEKLKKDKIKGIKNANQTHLEIGKKVRQTIAEIGGTMPENLPIADNMFLRLRLQRLGSNIVNNVSNLRSRVSATSFTKIGTRLLLFSPI